MSGLEEALPHRSAATISAPSGINLQSLLAAQDSGRAPGFSRVRAACALRRVYDGISFMICVATVMVCMAAILTPRAFQLAIAMFSSRCEVFYDAIALGGGAALDTH